MGSGLLPSFLELPKLQIPGSTRARNDNVLTECGTDDLQFPVSASWSPHFVHFGPRSRAYDELRSNPVQSAPF